jgi:biopolymer transport protein ExbD
VLQLPEPCRGGPFPLLPSVTWAPSVPTTDHDSEIRVTSDGLVYLGSRWFPDSELPFMFQRIAQRTLSHPGSRVLLRINRSTPFRTVRYLLRSLREIGIGDASLIVESQNPYAPSPAPNPGVQWSRSARH